MKVYKCDACGKEIANPYKVRMREFYVGCHFEDFGVIPSNSKSFKTIHICNECYHSLINIANKNKSKIRGESL